MQFSILELAKATGGRTVGESSVIDGLAIDSRLVQRGQLFVALQGDRDGHDFVASALSAGAGAALVERVEDSFADGPLIVVEDVSAAVEQLGRLARSRLGDQVIGVTGSLGKTTTKDLLASVLSQRFVTAASEKSFNNEIGVPITLMGAPDDTEVAVIEMGARGAGHIAYLCSIAAPTIGVVTTVEAVHTEVMGGVDAIARVKGELIEALPATGLAVLNSDVGVVADLAKRTDAKVITFGRTGDIRARDVSLDDDLVPSFVMVSPWGEVSVRLGVRGAHNVMNALAAGAVGLALGVSLDELAHGLQSSANSPWRMDLIRLESEARLLNDCYNASPASTTAALRALGSMDVGGTGRRFAVLGVMAELGDRTEVEHRNVAAVANDIGVEVLAVGTDLYGFESVADVDAALDVIKGWGLRNNDALLVKGSRVAGLEKIAEALQSADH